jgi:hypothetical protein
VAWNIKAVCVFVCVYGAGLNVQLDAAKRTVVLFARGDSGDPFLLILSMGNLNFVSELAACHFRRGEIPMVRAAAVAAPHLSLCNVVVGAAAAAAARAQALKRYAQIMKFHEDWMEDQFDFHQCGRRRHRCCCWYLWR